MSMGIVGFGGIGRETARRVQSLGLRVVAADIQPFQPEQTGHLAEVIYLVDGGGLERLLAESDVVVSAAPHTKRSEGMFDESRFATMRDGALFINVSRGKLVKTSALVAALKSGKLAGAGLDVTDPEPLPPEHGLWDLPNVLITSHIAGQSQHSWNRTLAVFTENVRRFTLGLALLNVVDKEAGF
jgi:phosphoglycerate dehydrogenase-like enzyme